MLKPRKLRKNKYQESTLDRFRGNFRPFRDFLAVFVWFCFVVALGAGLSRLYSRVVNGQWLELEKVDITGTHRLSRGEVLDAMGLGRGECTLGIDTQRVAARLGRLPVVDKAEVILDWRGSVAAHIEERKPVAVVVCAGHDMLMDSEGVLFAEVKKPNHSLPLITGLCDTEVRPGDSISDDGKQHIEALLSALEGSWLSNAAIDECRWSAGGFTLIMGQRAVPVNFGKSGYKQKLAKLKDVIDTLNDRGWTDLVTGIDLDYPGRAYVDGQFPVSESGQGTTKRSG